MIRGRLAAALLIGGASALAFEPVGWWPLLPLAFALLLARIARAATLGSALALGFAFGLGQFIIALNWIAAAFNFQSAMPAWLGWVAVLLVSLYLALFPALAAGLAWRLGRGRPTAMVLALAGGWAISEWLRAGLFTGFAWNPAGVTLIDTPWRAAAATVGTYGLSLLAVALGGVLWLALRRQWRPVGAGAALLALVLLLPGPELAGSRDFTTLPNPLPPRPLDAIRIVQPNIGQQDKWRPGFADEAARRLAALSINPGGQRPRLLFWPEAAVTEPLEDARTGEHRAMAEFERTRAAALLGPDEFLLTGGIAYHSSDGQRVEGAANSVFVIGAGGKVLGRYDKAHLVPYGEYLPMRPLLSAIGLSRLAPGNIDFVAGPGPRTIQLPRWGKVGFQLCYEIIFSGEVVDRRNRPNFIFNPSNDAWFGRWGPPQHLAQARLRAVEEGLAVIRSTPTGISALIAPDGRLVAALPWRRAGTIDAPLPAPAIGLTPFARFGNLLPLMLAAALLLGAIVLGRGRRYSAT